MSLNSRPAVKEAATIKPNSAKKSGTPTLESPNHSTAHANAVGNIVCAAMRRAVNRSTNWPDKRVPRIAKPA